MRIWGTLLAFIAFAIANLVPTDAAACGMFVARKSDNGSVPYLNVEQVLLVWDKDTGTEDFIRETRFERASEAFGFVVPVPSKPDVSAVKNAPFDALRAKYPFVDSGPPAGGGGPRDAGSDAGVTVLAEQRVGSFTAVTIEATESGALDKWLQSNGFASSNEAKPWVEHYVRLKFFFVAFRYAAPDGGALPGMTSETVRLRFKTGQPYYPYSEPAHTPGTPRPKQRQLSGWLVTHEPLLDVALRAPNGFGRPFELGTSYVGRSNALAEVVGPGLLPNNANIIVQPFRDKKISRAGFGDVIFVPARLASYWPEQLAAREPLLGVIDPRLVDDAVDAGVTAPDPAPAPERGTGCSTTPGVTSDAWPFFALLGVFALVRRRRALALVFVLACGRPRVESDAGAMSHDASAPNNRRTTAIAILSGAPGVGEMLVQDNDPFDDGLRPEVVLAGEPAITGGGTMVEPKKVFDGIRPRIRTCFHEALRFDASIEGDITFTIDLKPTGDVENVTFTTTGNVNVPVTTCAKKMIEELHLMPPKKPVHAVVTYRLRLEEQ